VPSANEAQTEKDLVRPVLEALGHTFEVQAALATPKGTKKPDYVFYRDQSGLAANRGKVLNDGLLVNTAFAIGDAKYWDRPLDVSVKLATRDAEINKIASDQIAFYMLHSGVAWGILTNGRKWRLYHKDTAQKLDRFCEVDLKDLIDAGDPEAFLYFYAFFHRSAFEDHPLGVAALLRESADYARGVSEMLKGQVYDALRHLAQGFLDYPGNRLQPDPTTLKAIYDHSLIVLYRLLFILYAEARARYDLHRRARRRILADLGAADKSLNQKLTAWWDLDFPALRAELQKVFERDIPLKDRDDWEEWLQARRAEHQQRTMAIVRMETELNARVYALFDLTPAEIAIIEESTKYRYGEV
jgi:hypothetical protein